MPIGLDGTYPIIGGDPSLATMPASTDGGLIGELSSAAEQLGAGQAIDLVKGMVMPAIMGAIKSPVPPAAPARRAGALVLSRNGTAEAGWGLCGAVAGHLVAPVAVSKHW